MRRTEIVVGLVSIISIALLVGGIIIGKGISIGANKHVLRVRLASSGGLDASSPVVVNGVKRGQVLSVTSNNGSVLVEAEIDDVSDLRADATALVTILEITGGKKLEIMPGTATQSLERGKEIPGRAAADIGGLVTMVGDLSGELITLLHRMDTLSAIVTNLMADGTISANLKSMAADGAVLVHDARLWMQENRADLSTAVKEMKGALADLRKAVNTNEPKLSATLDAIQLRLTELESLLAKGDRAIVGVDSLIVNVNRVIHDVRSNRSFANALLYDTVFRQQMDTLAFKFGRFVEQARVQGVNVNVGLGHK